MIAHGLQPLKPDHRDYDYHRTFGAVVPSIFPDSFSVDPGLTMPDQNADGYPEGCTSYAQTDLCTDTDHIIYKPPFTYKWTLFMDNLKDGEPCDMRTSLKSTIVYGVLADGEFDDRQALSHRRGAYFNVQPSPDWFDGIRSTLISNRRAVSVGTPWLLEWRYAPAGVIPVSFVITGHESWHNWVICGWKQVDGVPYLIGKTWQGRRYGDNGLAYFSRETINAVMQIPGTGAFTLVKATPDLVENVRLSILQTLLSYILRLKESLGV